MPILSTIALANLLAAQEKPLLNQPGGHVYYSRAEINNIDGTPDQTAPENYWKESKTVWVLIEDTNDAKPDKDGIRYRKEASLNYSEQIYFSRTDKLKKGDAGPFKNLIDIEQPVKADGSSSITFPKRTINEGTRTMVFAGLSTIKEVERRLIKGKQVERVKVKKWVSWCDTTCRGDWYDPYVGQYKKHKEFPEPNWIRIDLEDVKSFLTKPPAF